MHIMYRGEGKQAWDEKGKGKGSREQGVQCLIEVEDPYPGERRAKKHWICFPIVCGAEGLCSWGISSCAS